MKTRQLGIAVIFTTVVAFEQLLAGEPPIKATPGTPKIDFDKPSYDFGKSSQPGKLAGAFTLRNTGDGVLKLNQPITSCGCTVATIRTNVLQPGEEEQLTFTLSLPRQRGKLEKQITVDSNDPRNPKTKLKVKVDYTPLYEVTPESFSLTIHKGASTNVTVRVTRTDGKKFTVTKVEAAHAESGGWLQTSVGMESGPGDPTSLVTLSVKPDGSASYLSEQLKIYSDDSDQPISTVTVVAHVIGDLALKPESVYWIVKDQQTIANSPVRRITVQARSGEPLVIKNLSSSLDEMTVEAEPKEDGKSIEISAKLTALPDQTVNGTIHFDTNIPGEPNVDVPITIVRTPRTSKN